MCLRLQCNYLLIQEWKHLDHIYLYSRNDREAQRKLTSKNVQLLRRYIVVPAYSCHLRFYKLLNIGYGLLQKLLLNFGVLQVGLNLLGKIAGQLLLLGITNVGFVTNPRV